MTRVRCFISNAARIAVTTAVLALAVGGCFFDPDITLQNDPPVCINRSSIVASLIFPASSVCTLVVDDLNDCTLDVWTIPDTTIAGDTLCCDSSPQQSWPGSAVFVEQGLGTKKLHLTLDTNRMGRYTGILRLQDAASATFALPYTIDKLFFDPFDAFPPERAWWIPYDGQDSLHVKFDYVDKKLLFSFIKNDTGRAASFYTGIRTLFSLQGNCYTTVDFKLRDEMDEAFEVSFFISTSADTGRWAGDKAGIFITGISGRLRFECRSINLQSLSYESGATAGVLGIRRADSTISYFVHDGNPAILPKPLTSQTFPANVPVYIHMKMSVGDLSKTRNCYWNDFRIPEGLIVFPAD